MKTLQVRPGSRLTIQNKKKVLQRSKKHTFHQCDCVEVSLEQHRERDKGTEYSEDIEIEDIEIVDITT